MSKERLRVATELQNKIDNLSTFCFLASRNGFWEKVLMEKRIKLITNVHGFEEDNTVLRLDKEMTLKVIDVLKRQEHELQKELDGILNQALESGSE